MPYHSRAPIGKPLLKQIFGELRQCEHIALLGPREGAKALVLERLRHMAAELREVDRPRIVVLDGKEYALLDDAAFLRRLRGALGVPLAVANRPTFTLSDHVLEALRDATRPAVSRQPLWIFVQDVLAFPRPTARHFLNAMSKANSDYLLRLCLSVVITGSTGFIHLTFGSNSPYRYARPYLLTRLDEEFARWFFCQHRAASRGETPPDDAETMIHEEVAAVAFDYLYEQTGGNPHLIQEILLASSRYPFNAAMDLSLPWQIDAVKALVERYRNELMPHDYSLQVALREAEADPDSFELLHNLVLGNKLADGTPRDRFAALEVNGLLARTPSGALEVSSPMLCDFLQPRLNARHVGDVYAMQGKWDDAWRFYGSALNQQVERPVAGSARRRLGEVIGAWQGRLLDVAHESETRVIELFLNGMHHLLRFDFGGVYNSRTLEWIPVSVEGLDRDEAPVRRPGASSLLHLPGHVASHIDKATRLLLWSESLPTPLPDRPHLALFMGRRDEGRAIDEEDQRIVARALEAFWNAAEAARLVAYYHEIHNLRNRLLQVHERVQERLASHGMDMDEITRCFVTQLVTGAGYYRVLLCLVDSTGQAIREVVGYCGDPDQGFDYETNEDLLDRESDPADWDIQKWVVVRGQTCSVPDATGPSQRNPRVQWEAARRLGMRAITVIPMCVDGEVIGTVHVERTDKNPLGCEEQKSLEMLADQMAIIFRHLSGLSDVFRELVNWLGAEAEQDAAARVMHSFGERGYAWGELYLVRSDDDGRPVLKSAMSLNLPYTVQVDFERGAYTLPMIEDSMGGEQDCEVDTTAGEIASNGATAGIPAYWQSKAAALAADTPVKAAWSRYPLRVGTRDVGVLVLSSSRHTTPSRKAWLRVSTQTAALVLGHASQRELHARDMEEALNRIWHAFKSPAAALNNMYQPVRKWLRSSDGPRGPLGESEQNEQLEQIERMLRLMESPLSYLTLACSDFYRSERGYQPNIAETDMARVVQEVCDMCQWAYQELRIDLTSSESPLKARTDAAEVQRVLLELITNAYRHAYREGPGVVTVQLSADDRIVTIEVADRGANRIAAEDRERIFQSRFTTHASGTGRGLAHGRESLTILGGGLELVGCSDTETRFRMQLRRDGKARQQGENEYE